MNQTIGSLRVALGLDSAQFNAGLKEVQIRVDRLAGQMRRVGAAISLVGTGIAVAVRSQLNAADEMGEVAQKLGVPVESLTALQHAAKILGVEFGSLQTGLMRLSRGMANAPERFARLGIAVQDANGDLRPTADVLKELSDRFQSMPDGAEKTALAMDLFGKSGADLIPLLNAGSAGINTLMEEAKALGLVISQDTANAAGQFNENLDKLGAAATGLAAILAANFAPVLERASGFILGMASAFQRLSPEMQQFLSVLAGAAVVLGPALVGLSLMLPALSLLVSPLGLVAAGIAALVAAAALAPGALDAASVALTGMPLEEQLAAWQKFGADLKLIWDNWPLALQIVVDEMSVALTGMNWEEQKAAWRKFGDDLKLIWDNWPLALQIIFSGLAAKALPGLQAFGATVRNGANAAYNWFVNAMEQIWTYLAGLPAKWFQAGADMVQGLIDGFNARWESFKARIFSANEEAKATFQEDWMIQSPSRVTMEYGQYISEGLAIGIQQGAHQVSAALDHLSDTGVAQMETMSGKMQGLADGLAQGLTGIFEKLVSGARITLQDIGAIVSQIASTLFIQPFMSGLQSGLKGLFGGFAGGFATGGFIPPGQWGITGEAGPEIVSGGRSGVTVTPMGKQGGVHQVFNITTPDPNAFRYSQRQIQRRARVALGSM